MSDQGLAEQHGSDIDSYPEVSETQAGSHVSTLPFIKRGVGVADAIDQATSGETSVAGATGDIAGEIAMLGADAFGIMKDPIGALANAGVTIVLDLVQPLDELLLMVSGDAGEMQAQIDTLVQVQTALDALGEEIATAANTNITVWEGDAATAASDEIGGVSASARAIAKMAQETAQILDWARVLAETIYDVIKAILTEIVSWLITRGLAALASSVVTMGSSVAAFISSAIVKGAQTMFKAFGKYQKAVKIFTKIVDFIVKVTDRAAGSVWKRLLTSVTKVGLAAGKSLLSNASSITGGISSAMAPEQGYISGGSTPSDQFNVDVDELTAMASALDGLAPNADSISSVASGAGAAEMTWGLTGIWFEEPYTNGCEQLVESTNNLSEALTGDAEKLRACAEDYAASDDDAAIEFEGHSSSLDN